MLVASLAVLVPLQRRIVAALSNDTASIDAMLLRWFTGNLGRSAVSIASFALMVVAAVV